jgi:hypothetical protein
VSDRFADRLDPGTYASDEPVGAGTSNDYKGWVSIPERLFHRMQHLGRAYELHILPGLDPYDRNELDQDRTRSLIDELEFLAQVATDRALLEVIAILRDAALDAARNPLRSTKFFIEGP